MEGIEWGLKVLDDYISSNYPMLDKDSEPFQNYLKSAKYILNCANILVIPKKMETNKSKDDTKNRRVFKCIIFANDLNFWKWIQTFNITLDSGVYKTFDWLRDFLENQIPLLVINAYKKEDKEAFRENFSRPTLHARCMLWMLTSAAAALLRCSGCLITATRL